MEKPLEMKPKVTTSLEMKEQRAEAKEGKDLRDAAAMATVEVTAVVAAVVDVLAGHLAIHARVRLRAREPEVTNRTDLMTRRTHPVGNKSLKLTMRTSKPKHRSL